jgi:RimJ/RimL family protein N-acetyltransferase
MTRSPIGTYPDEPSGPFETPPRTFEDRSGREIGVEIARADDRKDLVEMYLAFDPADRAQGIPPTAEKPIRDWVDTLLEDGLNVVARHDGDVIGHGTLVPDDDEGYELAIFVLGDYRGAGIGTELIRTLLGHGAAHAVERVWLSVEPWNRTAIHVYEKVGFEPCGTDSFERRFSIRLARPRRGETRGRE